MKVQTVVKTVVQIVVKTGVETADINRLDKDSLYLYEEYKEKLEGKKFYEKVKIVGECQRRQEYINLSKEQQQDLLILLSRI